MPTLTTFLMFDDKAEDAVNLYLGLFDGKITQRISSGVEFEMLGRTFIAFNGGPHFKFSEGISLMVSCESQAEIDRYW